MSLTALIIFFSEKDEIETFLNVGTKLKFSNESRYQSTN